MGHTRLGSIPKTQKWRDVVAILSPASPEPDRLLDVAFIADRTLTAAETGLAKSCNDPGLGYTFYLLSQLVLAARSPDWNSKLANLGIRLTDEASIFDLSAGIQDAIDDYVFRTGGATDVSEMAQQAAGEAIIELAGTTPRSLFGASTDDLKAALQGLSTKKGFATVGRKFFSRFIARFLNFYLSRITAGLAGSPTMQHVGDITKFNDALGLHCYQSAKIVEQFCGEWYSKTEFQEGIDLDNSARFVAVAIRKLKSELQGQRAES